MSTPHVTIGGVEVSLQPRPPEQSAVSAADQASQPTGRAHGAISIVIEDPKANGAHRSLRPEWRWSAGAVLGLGLMIIVVVLLWGKLRSPANESMSA
jgi:hypothetical protein